MTSVSLLADFICADLQDSLINANNTPQCLLCSWASTTRLTFITVVQEKMHWFSVILVLCAVFSAVTAAKNFRWCTVNDDEYKKCEDFKKALPGIAKIAAVDITPGCVRGSDDEDCMRKIKDDKADFITLDGGKIYQAGKCYALVPIVAESYGSPEGISYYAVAVAKTSTTIDFRHLKGRKTCHTGYRRTAGWNMPVGRLLEEKLMENEGLDAKSASAYFNASCVPGIPKEYENLCKLCPPGSECSGDTKKNNYSSYHGAFRCMADGAGEVAFVKHLTTGEMVEDGKYGSMSDYKYLCTDGKFEVVTKKSHENCNLGANPSHAVVGRAGDNADYVKVLLKASMYCQPNKTANNCSDFLIFNSKKYGADKKDLLFKDSTKNLVDVGDKKTYEKWLGDGYTKSIEGLGSTNCSSPVNPVSPDPVNPGSGAMNINPLPALLAVLVVFIKGIL